MHAALPCMARTMCRHGWGADAGTEVGAVAHGRACDGRGYMHLQVPPRLLGNAADAQRPFRNQSPPHTEQIVLAPAP